MFGLSLKACLSAYATATSLDPPNSHWRFQCCSHCACVCYLLTYVWSVTIRPSGFTWPKLPDWKALDEEDLPHAAPTAPGHLLCFALYTLSGLCLFCIFKVAPTFTGIQDKINIPVQSEVSCITHAMISGDRDDSVGFQHCNRVSASQMEAAYHSMQLLTGCLFSV